MKRLISFIILFSSFLLLCPSIKAQWEGAQIQQLTDDSLPNRLLRLYIDKDDKLYLFYLQGVRDTLTGYVYDYRTFYITKEKGSDWSQPEEIKTSTYIFGMNKRAGLWMDTRTGVIHLLYSGYTGVNLHYTNSTIPNWDFVVIDSLPDQQWSPQHYSYIMDFDSSGNVHLVWHLDYDSAGYSWYRVIYANNSTGAWFKQVISPNINVGYGRSGRPFLCVLKDGTANNIYGTGYDICYYTRNDSLNSQNWVTDTIPRSEISLVYYTPWELLADASDRIHLFTGSSIWDEPVYQFYYYKSGKESIWSNPQVVQIYPPDSGFIREYFIDSGNNIHLSLADLGGSSVFYTNNKNHAWMELELLLFNLYDVPGATFKFVIDSEGRGHGAFIGYKYHGAYLEEDSSEVYYFSSTSSVKETQERQKDLSFRLSQNYPNPFNANTFIRYSLDVSRPVSVSLKVYNILGKEVIQLVNQLQVRGAYQVLWDGKNKSGKEVASGIYFYVLRAGERQESHKMLMLK